MSHDDQIEELYARFGSMVHRRCKELLGDKEEALDAMHEVFVDVIEKGDVTVHSPSSFLYVIATRRSLNRLRARDRRRESSDSELVYAIADNSGQSARTAARSVLDWLFGEQPESSGVIAVLHYVDGLTLQETAEEVGMSVSGVRKRLRRMRRCLEESGYRP